MAASLISLIFMISASFAWANSCPDLASTVAKKVEQNTFTLIPRNTYAESISTERAREIHTALCHKESLTLSEKLNCETLRTCEGLHCKIEHMGHGTAFLTQHKKSLLLTAWHVVFPTHAAPLIFFEQPLSKLSTSELNKKLQVLEPDFLLMNSAGSVVFDTRKNLDKTSYAFWGDPLSTVYQGTGKKRGTTYGYFENAASDFVGIQLPENLQLSTQPLSVSPALKKGDLPSSCLYSAGYPYFNGQFAISAGRNEHFRVMQKKLSSMIDFTLKPMNITTDELLKKTIPEILHIMGYSKELIEQTISKYDATIIMNSIHVMLNVQARNMRDQQLENHDHVLFVNAPVLPGQSGGPILDASGNVVGITTNAFYDKLVTINDHYASYGAAGIFIGALDFEF